MTEDLYDCIRCKSSDISLGFGKHHDSSTGECNAVWVYCMKCEIRTKGYEIIESVEKAINAAVEDWNRSYK